jgi:hypothetical protein
MIVSHTAVHFLNLIVCKYRRGKQTKGYNLVASIVCLQGGDEVAQKANQVIVLFLERQPGDRSPAIAGSFTQQ